MPLDTTTSLAFANARNTRKNKDNKAQALGLLELNDKHIQPSEKGFNAINTRKNKDRKTFIF
jgi:hypothetical protein